MGGGVVRARSESKASGESQFEDEATSECGPAPGATVGVVGVLSACVPEAAEVQAPQTDREELRFNGQVIPVIRLAVRVRTARERPWAGLR